MPHPATYSLLLSPRRTMPTTWPPTCWSPCLPPWCASWARWSNWPYRSTPICRASSAHWLAAGRRASASRCGRVRWWSRSVKPARRCLPAGCKASTCTPRTSPAAGCCSTRLGRNPFRHTPMQYSGRRTRRIDRVSCYADSPRSWNTTGTGDQPPPRCGSTGTPCATASKRSNDWPGGEWTPRGPPRVVAGTAGPRRRPDVVWL